MSSQAHEEGADDRIQRQDLSALVHEHLAEACPDVLRDLLKPFVQTLMSAEAQVLCNAEYGEPSAERTKCSRWPRRTMSLWPPFATGPLDADPCRRHPGRDGQRE